MARVSHELLCTVKPSSYYLWFYLKLSVNASTPNLDGQYPPEHIARRPPTLVTFIILPLAFFTNGIIFIVTLMRPIKLTSIGSLKCSTVNQSVGAVAPIIPALLIRAQRPVEEKSKKIACYIQEWNIGRQCKIVHIIVCNFWLGFINILKDKSRAVRI